MTDKHAELWDRFSWFGFCVPIKPTNDRPLWSFKALAEMSVGSPDDAIADMEALLIKAMGPSNSADMKFKRAAPWYQVERDQVECYMEKIQSR